MEHERALEAVTEHILGLSPAGETLDEAIRHVLSCPSCLREVDTTLALLRGTKEGLVSLLARSLPCGLCQERLSEILDLDEALAEEWYPLEMAHVRECKPCAQAYQLQAQAQRLAPEVTFAKELAPSTSRAASEATLWRVEAGVRCLVRTIAALCREGALHLGKVPQGGKVWAVPELGRQPGYALIRTKTASKGWLVVLPDEEAGVDIEVHLRVVGPDRIACEVHLRHRATREVVPPDRVCLRQADRLIRCRTGRAVFRIPPGTYTVAVFARGREWLVPLEVLGEEEA